MPQIIAAMDEDSKMTRLMACRIVGVLLKVCGRQFDEDNFTKTYTGECRSLILFFLMKISTLNNYSCIFTWSIVVTLVLKAATHGAGAVGRFLVYLQDSPCSLSPSPHVHCRGQQGEHWCSKGNDTNCYVSLCHPALIPRKEQKAFKQPEVQIGADFV